MSTRQPPRLTRKDALPPLARAIFETRAKFRSQAEIGQRLGEVLGRGRPVDQTVVGSWMRGDAEPSIKQVLALDEVCGWPRGTILRRAGLIEEDSQPEVDDEAGVADVMELQSRGQGTASCLLGHHAWVPWLETPSGSFVTWCCRPGCEAREQWDGAS